MYSAFWSHEGSVVFVSADDDNDVAKASDEDGWGEELSVDLDAFIFGDDDDGLLLLFPVVDLLRPAENRTSLLSLDAVGRADVVAFFGLFSGGCWAVFVFDPEAVDTDTDFVAIFAPVLVNFDG